MSNTYLVWVLQNYEARTPDGNLADVVIYEIIADSPDDALKRAQSIAGEGEHTKKGWRIARCIEKRIGE